MEYSVRIRTGLLTLVVGSLLGIVGLALRGPVPLPIVDVDSWARAVTETRFAFSTGSGKTKSASSDRIKNYADRFCLL